VILNCQADYIACASMRPINHTLGLHGLKYLISSQLLDLWEIE
jgi:hypothetical protein